MNAQASDKPQPLVLLVDDDASLLRLISLRLESGGFAVDAVENADIALSRIATRKPDVVVTDLRMTGMDGMTLFRRIRESNPMLPVIILTAHGTIADAVAATQQGVFGFLTKPFNSRELLDVVEAAAAGTQPQATEPGHWRSAIVTRSRLMQNLLDELELIAESDASVLILGESGTGKEIIARALHAASARADGPFVPVNCAAMPADLLEAELFGHAKGAFTGADRDRQGLFVQADGGTLLLDEIGDMPMEFQAKLLRAVQDKAVRPVGAARELAVNVRLLSATHRDLEQAIRDGQLREDLYYRLNVVRLELPPLRERPEDIPLLAEHFLAEFQASRAESKRIHRFSTDAMRQLIAHSWPGNIRQLRNVVEQVSALCRKGPIPLDLVQRALRQEQQAETKPIPLADARIRFEREYLVRMLRMTQGNVAQAARLAGRNRTEFYRLLKRHHLEAGDFKSGK